MHHCPSAIGTCFPTKSTCGAWQARQISKRMCRFLAGNESGKIVPMGADIAYGTAHARSQRIRAPFGAVNTVVLDRFSHRVSCIQLTKRSRPP